MNNTIAHSDLLGLLTNVRPATKNNINASCPICGKSGHFFINVLTQKWDCKKCGRQGGIKSLLFELERMDLMAGPVVDLGKQLKKLGNVEEEETIDLDIRTIKMPIGSKKLDYDADTPMVNYLKSRKLTRKDFELYEPSSTDLKERYNGYALLKIKRDFLLKAFIARYALDIPEDSEINRYDNSRSEFSKLLFGLDEVNAGTDSLILVEGALDKIGVTTELNLHKEKDFKCLGTFGKKISAAQLLLLNNTGANNIFLMFDARDAVNDMKQKAYTLERTFKNVFITYLYPEDPNEATAKQLLQALEKAKRPAQFWFDKIQKRKLK